MKVIDLLNKIANGEEVPKKIHFKYSTYQFDEIDKVYRNINGNQQLEQDYMISNKLNDGVEIIEEDNKIEKLTEIQNRDFLELPDTHDIMNKINELIDVINEMKKGE